MAERSVLPQSAKMADNMLAEKQNVLRRLGEIADHVVVEVQKHVARIGENGGFRGEMNYTASETNVAKFYLFGLSFQIIFKTLKLSDWPIQWHIQLTVLGHFSCKISFFFYHY